MKIKNTTILLLSLIIILFSYISTAEDSSPVLSDGPQTLSTDSADTKDADLEILDENSSTTATDSNNSSNKEEPKTEAKEAVKEEVKEEIKPVSSEAPKAENQEIAKEDEKVENKSDIKLEELKPQTEPETKKSEAKKDQPQVLDEDDLLIPESKKPKKNESPKVKSEKVTETEMYIQEADKFKLTDTFKNLRLNDVIEQGLRKNYQQNIRTQEDQLNEIHYSGAKDAYWLPNLKLSLTTTDQRISTLHSGTRASLNPSTTTPSGVAGLSLGNYTIFNWGKDYALFLNTKSSYQRNKQIFEESRRELKLDLIGSFFALMATKNIEKIRQDQLRHASFVYRLNKEKITIGKTSKQDYYQSRSEYLIAQNDFHQAKMDSDIADENMAFLIADDIGTKYVLSEYLDYRRLKVTLDDALTSLLKKNPTLLTSQTAMTNSERSYEVALKENMPLPKFTVNLGAYNKRFGTGANSTIYETSGGGNNVELVASINASWDIIGEDGLLNSNKLAISRINKELALKEFEKNKSYTQSLMRQTYKNILSLQNQVSILEARLPSLQKTFDIVLENYLASRTKYIDLHSALADLTSTKILFEKTKLQHLQDKITLAKLAGLEDFPGENFEQLATQVKGK